MSKASPAFTGFQGVPGFPNVLHRIYYRQLPATVGLAQVDQRLVVANHAGKTGQDRSEGRQTCPVCDVSNGRSAGVEIAVL